MLPSETDAISVAVLCGKEDRETLSGRLSAGGDRMNLSEELRAFGALLKGIREAMSMSRRELAVKVGCKYDDIRLYENGGRIMRVDRLLCILDAFGIHLSEESSFKRVYKAVVMIASLSPEQRQALLDQILSMIDTATAGRDLR